MWVAAIGFILFGFGKLFFPKRFRFYYTWEIFGKRDKMHWPELLMERITGAIVLVIGVIILIREII